MWRAALAVVACSSPAAPLRNTAPPDPPPKRLPGLTIQFDDEPAQLFGDRGACLTGGDTEWHIDVPSREDDCTTGQRPDDDWFTLEPPRCGAKQCPVPQPGASYDLVIRLLKSHELDDVILPIRARVTVKRHQPPFVILELALLSILEDHGVSRITIGGELAVRFDDDDLVDATSWRR